MFNRIKNIFVKSKPADDDLAHPVLDAPVFGEIPLIDMVKYSFTGNWVFHGSPVKLEPGIDRLEPRTSYFGGRVVHMGDISTALRFGLVRLHRDQCDQMQGLGFYVFCSKKHRLIIYNGFIITPTWYNAPVTDSCYLYMSPRTVIPTQTVVGAVSPNPTVPVPITARAVVNQQTLADAGFSFVVDVEKGTKYWWGIKNTDSCIENRVLPECLLVYNRGQR